jgi:DNA polymerase-3 subunit delta
VRDFNVTVLDGRKVTLAELRHAADAVPFMADKRLVVVEGLLARLSSGRGKSADDGEPSGAAKELLADLLAYLPGVPESTRLVFVEAKAIPASHPLFKLAVSQSGKTILAFETPKNAVAWIEQRAKKHGGAIDRKAAAKLAQLIGNDLRRLDSEIQKLITYVNAGRPIRGDDVDQLVSASIEANVFDLVDALGRRDGQRAMRELHRLLDLGENPLGLLAMITRQFRLLIQVKELQETSVPAPEMPKRLGQHPFVVEKIGQQARNFSLEQLERIYSHLLDLDVGIKTGETSDVLALDLLVAELAG